MLWVVEGQRPRAAGGPRSGRTGRGRWVSPTDAPTYSVRKGWEPSGTVRPLNKKEKKMDWRWIKTAMRQEICQRHQVKMAPKKNTKKQRCTSKLDQRINIRMPFNLLYYKWFQVLTATALQCLCTICKNRLAPVFKSCIASWGYPEISRWTMDLHCQYN